MVNGILVKAQALLLIALVLATSSFAGGTVKTNPPGCDPLAEGCKCQSGQQVSANCIKVNLDLGETTPWTGSLPCSLKVFADDEAIDVFTPESLYAVLDGYTYKRLGQKTMSDGQTPAEVVLNHPNGEPVHFVFNNDETLGCPTPGVYIEMDARLMMVDAEGWAANRNPVYYDLYVGDGSRRRFLATNMTGRRGSIVSTTDAKGVEWTASDMGIDIIYDSDCIRQFLTPSRLADIIMTDDYQGYDVIIYPLQAIPEKDPATGFYIPPDAQPVERMSLRPENNHRRAIVTLQSGDSEPKEYVFNYEMGDWSLTRPSGVRELKDRLIADELAAQIVKEVRTTDNRPISRTERNYKWESWGFAVTNRVEGYGGVTDITEWTYYKSGSNKGQVKTKKSQTGLVEEYVYDDENRIVSEKRSGPDMMTEVTTYSYAPVDSTDPVLPVDTRPRTIVKTLNGIECERTYYVYSPLTNIVERVGSQGAAYGGTNALRTVTAFYPAVVGDIRSGKVKSIRYENGKIDVYDYALASNLWTETVTHLHEQAPEPVGGKTTRDITVMNERGETIETRTEAFIGGDWHVIARNRMTYNLAGKIVRKENLAGQVTTTDWDCCHKTHEIQPDGSTTTWDYDDDGRLIETSRLIPLDMTNQTWVTTCYEYDDLGRQIASWQTNATMHVGLPAIRTAYDPLGRATNRVDMLGNDTTTSYSADGRTLFVHNPNTSTRITNRSADGDIISITGTAATPEFHTYGILPDGTRWTKIVHGETAESPRFTKRYENMLGQTVREERSGFQGAMLATVNSYDGYGRLVSAVADYEPRIEYSYDELGNRIATTRFVEEEWRKTQAYSLFAIDDGIVWLMQTNIVSCSDASIAPLVSSEARQLTGLASSTPLRMRSTDIRSNVTEKRLMASNSAVISRQTVPYASNKPLSVSRFGIEVQDVSVSAVTNTYAYDELGRSVATTDGCGNTMRIEYNALGQRSASIDALGNRTTYAYDAYGNLAAITNPLGNAIVYEYDLRGRKTYEGGATYPVRYTYDVFGNKTTMMTYRKESLGPDSGDVTTWLYDEASGSMTNKVYADGKGPTYSYTPDGKLTQRIWARRIITDYSYDGWGNLTNTVYSDDTPTVSLFYDAFGRQTEAHDAAGVTTFRYDIYGSLTNETVVGVAGTNTIERYWDEFGRTAGYALNGTRQTTIGYCPATGRIESMLIIGSTNAFHWTYILGSDLKSQLQYPNGLTASWQYDAVGQLLQVSNATPTNVISQYDYTYDAAGQRVACAQSGSSFEHEDVISYAYNARSELTNAVANVDAGYRYSYQYDDIGNRVWSNERGTNVVYSSNELNQYTAIDNFSPEYDDDGNQTLIRTKTGTYHVLYNVENKLFSVSNDLTTFKYTYDYRGRLAIKQTQNLNSTTNCAIYKYKDNSEIFEKIYNGEGEPEVYMINWSLDGNHNTFPISVTHSESICYYLYDGNKNVTEFIGFTNKESDFSHFTYSPFGDFTPINMPQLNDLYNKPFFMFSGEHYDLQTSLVLYKNRFYNSIVGRWNSRDPLSLMNYDNLYLFVRNNPILLIDYLGLAAYKWGSCPKRCCNGKCTQLVPLYVCERPLGGVIQWGPIKHSYVCCAGVNQGCYGVQKYVPSCMKDCLDGSNSLVRKLFCHNACYASSGTLIEHEMNPTGTCKMQCVTPSEKDAACQNPRMPWDYSILSGQQCNSWAQQMTTTSCTGSACND